MHTPSPSALLLCKVAALGVSFLGVGTAGSPAGWCQCAEDSPAGAITQGALGAQWDRPSARQRIAAGRNDSDMCAMDLVT